MEQATRQTAAGLTEVLRRISEEMQEASGAEIVTLYLYDADSRHYYAPVALGIPEADLVHSVPDMQDQLARYLADVAQGKAPAELQPQQYGPNVWLTVTRRPLVARDAPENVGSSFVRRFQIRSMIGLPLVADDTLVGLLYLDFTSEAPNKKPARNSDEQVAALQRRAAKAAQQIERARRAEERAAFATASELAGLLSPAALSLTSADGFRTQIGAGLARLLDVTEFDAAVVYRSALRPGHLDLVGQQGLPGAPSPLVVEDAAAGKAGSDMPWNPAGNAELQQVVGDAGLHVVAALPLRTNRPEAQATARPVGADLGCLLMLSRDELAYLRRTTAARLLLQSAAELLGGALAGQQLIMTLEDANRVLGALGRMTSAMLKPGSSRQQVLEAVVGHLIDADVPEFDFQFASVFLLSDAAEAGGPLIVRMAAGAAADASIDAALVEPAGKAGAHALRVPRWVQIPNREVAPDDVLAYCAHHWQIAVIGSAVAAERPAEAREELVVGYPPEQWYLRDIPAVRSDGSVSAVVPAALIAAAGAVPQAMRAAQEPPARPFTLDGDIFDNSGHGDLVRIFAPFGLGAGSRATGVLEVGYHRSHKRHVDRTQVEALRAAVALVAVAVETARLYEETKRHAEQLEVIAEASKAMAGSIDLDQTLRIVARNLARSVGATLCQIALYEDEGAAWYGAAASDEEALWRRQRGEQPERSFLFDLFDKREPLLVTDALNDPTISPYYARLFGIRSLLALPLVARDQIIGAAILVQREAARSFTPEEARLASGLAHQAAIAIQNARVYSTAEEDPHIQRDVVQIGFGEWGQKAYQHWLTLKQFFNFKTHIVERDIGGRRKALEAKVAAVEQNGDVFYWDSADNPAREQLRRELESSCYVVTYIATPGPTHLPMLQQYYDMSNVVVIEKPLGAPIEEYRQFLDHVEAGVQIVAADHYFFKLEVRLLHLLLTEERTLKAFLDDVEEIEMELVEERPLTGAAADIGIIEDMMPHAFAIISLFTPIDRIQFDQQTPVEIGRQQPIQGKRESYARIRATFPHRNRTVNLIIDVGKGVENSKWIKLSGERRLGGRPAFYKFDFAKGQAVDGTQTNLHAAVRQIRQPGVPDNAHLTMLRHVIEKRYPAVGILAIREAMRSNQRIQDLVDLASELLEQKRWMTYQQGQRPRFPDGREPRLLGDGRVGEQAAARVG